MSKDKPGHWVSLFKSFNPNFYQDIADQSFGRSLGYILLLSFIISFLLSTKYTIEFSNFIPKAKDWALTHITEIWPKGLNEIKIENGQVSSPAAQPFIHKWKEFVFILDTTNQIGSLNEYNQGLLIAKNKVIFKDKKSDYETRTEEYDLSKVKSFIIRQGNIDKGMIAEIRINDKPFNITAEVLKFWLKLLRGIIFFIMLLWFFLYYPTAKIFQGVIFALFALIPNNILKANLSYRKLLNIALYALTPATALAVITVLAGIRLPLFWFAYCLTYGVYLVLGIKGSKEDIDASGLMAS